MSYWDETDRYLREHGRGPNCLSCGREMFPEDDHGRFFCSFGGGSLDVVSGMRLQAPEIPQVDTSGMSDEEKAKIPPINRLKSPPTAAEAKFMRIAAGGPDCMDDPEYWAASRALDEERKE